METNSKVMRKGNANFIFAIFKRYIQLTYKNSLKAKTKKVHHNNKKIRMALLLFDKTVFKTKTIVRNKQGFQMLRINSSIIHKNSKFYVYVYMSLYVYVPINGA